MAVSSLGSAKTGSVATASGVDLGLLSKLGRAGDTQAFCQSWLAIQCRLITGVSAGVVLLQREEDARFAPMAIWPDVRRDMSYLTATAQRALVERKCLSQPPVRDGGGWQIGYPIDQAGALVGVVVLDIAARPEAELQLVMRQLQWGATGIELLFARKQAVREAGSRQRLQTVLELTAAAVNHERYLAAAMALSTELATHLACDCVSIGFSQAGEIKVDAVSHSAQFKQRSNAMREVAAAMEEAVDQGATIACPPLRGAPPVLSRCHEALSKDRGGAAVCTVPLRLGAVVVGAITLERPAERPFDAPTLELLDALVSLAGPVLEVHRREDRWFGKRAALWWQDKLRQLIGPRHPGLKLAVASAALMLLVLAVAKGDFRVSASSTLEPLVQQAAAAPFNGYVREAPLRAGDLVKQGALLARLDDRDLRLERLKWLGQEEELSKQFRQAMADRNAAQVQIVSAQLEQSRAQVARAQEQLARTTITAPFDGVVVSGDLSQQLGAPVERGAVLFEVAPLASFRLVLKIDERDIAHLKVGQRGALRLSAFPHEVVGFELQNITPVSTPKEGRNFFRVEAKLDALDPRMRPGMEGVGKVEIERRRYLWIWTRPVADGLRLLAWQWLP